MNLKYILAVASFFTVNTTFAHKHGLSCQERKVSTPIVAKATVASIEETHYDIQHVKFDIAVSNATTAISGNATTTAKVIANSMPVYAFELNQQLAIDSIKFNNQLITVPAISGTSIYKLTLPTALPQNAVFTAQVFYHGQPTAGSGFFTSGINLATSSNGTPYMYTLSDMYTACEWWPSKQDIQDKIDSVDMWVTVNDNLKAGSNGLLKNVTQIAPGKKRFEWKTNYKIDYYLIMLAVAPYGDYSTYMHFTDGSGDSMLVQHYVYDSLQFMTQGVKARLDSTNQMIDDFSKIFGKYPFYKEKYGHCRAEQLSGGMEHQTMTTLAFPSTTLIAHELGHQWWGDHVTYKTWADIWLSEGFATYAAQLYMERFWGATAARNERTATFNRITSKPGGSVYVDDTTDAYRVFDSRLTYDKGGAVAHMLRYFAPQDDMYFTVLKNYQQQFAFGLASTADLHQIAEQVYGKDLDTFFTQWVYGEGYPVYAINWFQEGQQFHIRITQNTSKPTSVACFSLPVELKLKSAAGDTIVKLYNNQPMQDYNIPVGRTVTGIEIDPNEHIPNKKGNIIVDPTLSVKERALQSIHISPNPATNAWYVNNTPKNTHLVLTDMSGKVLWEGETSDNMAIPCTNLPAGNYLLNASTKDGAPVAYKLAK